MPRKLIKYVPEEIALPNLAENWLSKAMTPSGISNTATDTIKNGIRTIQGVITDTNASNTYGGKYFHTSIVNSWLNPNQTSKKFIITCDFMDMTEKETGTVAFYSNGTMNAISGVLRNTTQRNVWQRVACVGSIPNSIDSRRHGLAGGEAFKYAFKDFAVYDVTNIDSSLYPAIARGDWYAFITGFEAIQMRAGRGIIRSGRRISIDTASEDEVASGAFDKAVTPDKLKAWVENGDNYKVKDNNGNWVILDNGAKNYLTTPMQKVGNATDPQQAVWGNIRSNWGNCGASNGYTGLWFSRPSPDEWFGMVQGSVTGKFIVALDLMDETDSPHTNLELFPFNGGTPTLISSVPRYCTELHKWTRVAYLLNLSNAGPTFDFHVNGMTAGMPFRYSFKNICVYNVTNIPEEYYPILAKGQHPLLQGVEPVDITDNVISYKKATVADVVGGSTHKNYIVDARTLHDAIDGGIDVTEKGLYTTLDPGSEYDIRGIFELTATASNGSIYYYGFTSGPYLPFPSFVNGRRYLYLADVKNNSSIALNLIAFNDYVRASGYIPVDPVGSIPRALNSPSANQITYTRLAGVSYEPYNCIRASQSTGSVQTIKVGVRTWRQYDVTDLTDAQIEELAGLSEDQLDARYYYFIKQDSVCPFIPIVDVSSMSTVSVQAGLVYRIIATSGTHVLTVSNLPTDAVGDEAYIQIKTGSSSTITVQQPLMLMDAIKPNAINNCVVKFINGEARLYVEDVSNGYVVVNASGTEYGSLHYGLSNLSNIDVNYISFGSTVDNITVHSSEPIAFMHQPVSIVGNGRDITTIDFDHGVIGTDKSFYVGYATIKDVTVNGGNIQLENGGLEGVIKLEGSSLSLSGRTKFNATVIGNNISITASEIISGSGTIDLNNKLTPLSNINLSGITIKNGYRTSTQGGAIRYTSSGTYIVTNCLFDNNKCIAAWNDGTGGGALISYNTGTTVSLIGCTISNSTASNCGGAIRVRDGGAMTAENCLFENNKSGLTTLSGSASNGGGVAYVYAGSSKFDLKNCTMRGNSASDRGGAIYYASGSGASTISNCIISDNTAGIGGGGISANANTVTIKSTIFENNSAPIGNAIYTTSGPLVLENCTFKENQTIKMTAGSLSLSGTNLFMAKVEASSISIASGATISLIGNSTTDAITATSITAAGTFVVIDKNGTSHSYSAATKSNSKITNLGVWS